MSRQETAWPSTPNSGCVSPMIQTIEASSARRVISANASPTCRARFWRSGGSRPARIAMNTRLSIPRTISSAVSVRRLAQICGSLSQSTLNAPKRSRSAGVGYLYESATLDPDQLRQTLTNRGRKSDEWTQRHDCLRSARGGRDRAAGTCRACRRLERAAPGGARQHQMERRSAAAQDGGQASRRILLCRRQLLPQGELFEGRRSGADRDDR